MLPVITGFIFPNGEKLDTGTKGHRREAFRYIVKNKLLDKYDEFCQTRGDGEDDFLIEVLGAVKICHYFGENYIYVPRPHGDYIESVKKVYEEHKYLVKYYDTLYTGGIKIEVPDSESCNMHEVIYDMSQISYNQTVIRRKGEYIYNPIRDGD